MFPQPPPVIEWIGGDCIHTLVSMLRLCDEERAELYREGGPASL